MPASTAAAAALPCASTAALSHGCDGETTVAAPAGRLFFFPLPLPLLLPPPLLPPIQLESCSAIAHAVPYPWASRAA